MQHQTEDPPNTSPRRGARLVAWTRHHQGCLRGFFDIKLPCGLTLIGCTAWESQDGKRWVSLPSRPVIGRDGRQRISDSGARQFEPTAKWERGLGDKFSEKVIALIERRDASAFSQRRAAA